MDGVRGVRGVELRLPWLPAGGEIVWLEEESFLLSREVRELRRPDEEFLRMS